jgi:hypothetical protein
MGKLFFALILLVSASVHAQESRTSLPSDSSSATDGLRISYVRSYLTVHAREKSKGTGETVLSKSELDKAEGVAVGYAKFPAQQFGWDGAAAFIQTREQGAYYPMARISGDLGYMFTENFGAKAGGNVSTFLDSDMLKLMLPSFGFQAHGIIQFTRNFGADLGYTRMSQVGVFSKDGLKTDFTEDGFEFSLTGTF